MYVFSGSDVCKSISVYATFPLPSFPRYLVWWPSILQLLPGGTPDMVKYGDCIQNRFSQMSNDQNPGWLGFIGDDHKPSNEI